MRKFADPTTHGKCLISKSELQTASPKVFSPSQYHPRRHRRFGSASRARWFSMTILCFITLSVAAGLLIWAAHDLAAGGDRPFALGFGAVNTRALIGKLGSIEAMVFLANCPQLILSFLYFTYNGVWTCMLMVEEWVGYFKERKPLRVTTRSGLQRSTYRLQVPYRYGIPLMVVSAVLHWLVSQSIFLVVLNAYKYDGTPDQTGARDRIGCGYSPIAILITIIVGTLVLLAGLANGFRRYPEVGIPLAGSCSTAISAACHPPPGDDRPSKKAVMWGAIKESNADEEVSPFKAPYSRERCYSTSKQRDGVKVGHCTFTSLPVDEPFKGELYAGLKT